MKYRVFGAVWKSVDGRKYILGYWFADQVNEIYQSLHVARFSDIVNARENEVTDIYNSIRKEQDIENWSKRRMLQLFSIMKKPELY